MRLIACNLRCLHYMYNNKLKLIGLKVKFLAIADIILVICATLLPHLFYGQNG